MASYNKIQLLGKLNDRPNLTSTTDGVSLSKFTLMVPRTDSLPSERFDRIPVCTWRENADKSAEFNENDLLFIEGRILVKGINDPTTGQKKWITEVEARQVHRISDVFNVPGQSQGASKQAENKAPSIETMSFQPVDDRSFFNDQSTESSKTTPLELEEDVPF